MAERKEDQARQLSADLLGYHLGIADEETRARVEAAFGDAESLASAREALQAFLAPLDADVAPVPPPDLVAAILDRVEAAENVLPMRQADPAGAASAEPAARELTPVLPAAADHGTAGGPLLSLREIVGLAAAILIFIGILVPGYRTARRAAQRTVCADNLRLIGNGYVRYAAANGRYWPYARPVPVGASWSSTAGPGVARFRNSQHVFQLVRGRYTRPKDHICPSREGDFALRTDSPEDLDGFPDPRNNSYATNFITRPWKQGEFAAQMPIMADETPLVDQHRRLVPLSRASMNSNSHGRSFGQNVLRINVSVRFFKSPDVGIDDDDIYRLYGIEEYTGQERPNRQNDSFLIP